MKKQIPNRLPGFFERNLWSRYPGVIAGIIFLAVVALILYWRQVPREKGLANLFDTKQDITQPTSKEGEGGQEAPLTPATKEAKEGVEKNIALPEPFQEESKESDVKPSLETTAGLMISVRALRGQGITHLARTALQKYLDEQKPKTTLTKEHKIFIEDFLKDASVKKRLYPESELTFSFDLIEKAIAASKQISPAQLASITRYSQKVPSLGAYVPVT